MANLKYVKGNSLRKEAIERGYSRNYTRNQPSVVIITRHSFVLPHSHLKQWIFPYDFLNRLPSYSKHLVSFRLENFEQALSQRLVSIALLLLSASLILLLLFPSGLHFLFYLIR